MIQLIDQSTGKPIAAFTSNPVCGTPATGDLIRFDAKSYRVIERIFEIHTGPNNTLHPAVLVVQPIH